jgi:carboxylesterase
MSNTITLQRKLAGLVEVCVLDDSYHMVTLDRQRPIVMDRVKEFALRLTKGGEEAQEVSAASADIQGQGRGESA